MQALSREVIFGTLPNPPRRKRLGKKVLGLSPTIFPDATSRRTRFKRL
jgi:hypothetical protein